MIDCQLFGLNGVSSSGEPRFPYRKCAPVVPADFPDYRSPLDQRHHRHALRSPPFQVESVVGSLSAKNLVSTFFALLTLLAYVKFTEIDAKAGT